MTAVKICGLTNLADARWAWKCGADLLGFILVPSSKRYVTAKKAAAVVTALRAEGCTAQYVGVFADRDLRVVDETAELCGFDYAQLHSLDETASLSESHTPVVIAHRVRGTLDWSVITRLPAWAYLLDSYKPGQLGGTGESWQWSLIGQGRPETARLILAGGLTPENVPQAIRQIRPWGVDVATGTECCPGHKDPDKVARFISTVREEDQR